MTSPRTRQEIESVAPSGSVFRAVDSVVGFSRTRSPLLPVPLTFPLNVVAGDAEIDERVVAASDHLTRNVDSAPARHAVQANGHDIRAVRRDRLADRAVQFADRIAEAVILECEPIRADFQLALPSRGRTGEFVRDVD